MKKQRKNLILVLNHAYQYEPVEGNEEKFKDEALSENTELDTDGIAFSFRAFVLKSHVIARSNHL